MRGNLKKRGSVWTARWSEITADGQTAGAARAASPPGAKPRRTSPSSSSGSLTAPTLAPSRITVAGYLAEWLDEAEAGLRPLSADRYRNVVRLYIEPEIGAVKLQALSGRHLTALYLEDMEKAGLSASTRKLTHAVLSLALSEDAVLSGELAHNPLSG